MSKRQPLYVRLFWEPHLTDLVRLFGWQGIPVPEAQEKLKPLADKYGKEKLQAATEEIVEIDHEHDPPMARLTEEVRRLVRPLLGPPPENSSPTPQHAPTPHGTATPVPCGDPEYRQFKEAHPGALVLFRMGDFYELFYEDAEVVARVLGLTLTRRNKGDNPVPMASFPSHALESYLGKLIRAGYRVAICDQVEDPREGQGLVRRQVTRIVTPGRSSGELPSDTSSAQHAASRPAAKPVCRPGTDRPVRLPRKDVLARFADHLKEKRIPHVAVDEAKRALFTEARIYTLDFVVYSEHQQNLLVTVRPHLRSTQRHDMRRWQEVFGPDFQAVRFWPVEGLDSWDWTQYPIEPEAPTPPRREAP